MRHAPPVVAWRHTTLRLLTAFIVAGATQTFAVETAAPSTKVSYIHSSDLLHPHDDPDDHFDLATAFALPELDVKAVMLDLGDRQKQRPGTIPVRQLLDLTGRKVPFATGLVRPLKAPDDKGLDQPKEDQGAVELLLRTLRNSPEPVVVNTVGSERDVCAAFNREPELLRGKISRLYVNTGNLDGKNEWNVGLDRHAYVGLMRCGLSIYWCPCMPAGENRTSHWKFKHAEVLDGVPAPLLNYFIYALQQVDPREIDPIKAMHMDLRPWRRLIMPMERNMWSTGSMIHAAGRRIYRVGDRWVSAASAPREATPADVFTFVPVRVTIDDKCTTSWRETTDNANMRLYKVTDPKNHEAALKSCLRELLARFPVATAK